MISILLAPFALIGCSQRRPISTFTIETTIVEIQATNQPGTMETTTTLEPYIFKVSDPGMITIHGLLLVLDPTVMLPDPNDAIFLVPISGDEGVTTIPNFRVGEVPQADVDERTGEFVFVNIQPGKYAIVVLTKANAQIPARFYESGNLTIFSIDESHRDKTFELEYLQLP